MRDLKGKNGIIFGSTGILGKAITTKLACLNANIIIQGKTFEKLTKLDDELRNINKKVTLLHANVIDKDFSRNLLKAVFSRFKKIDFLINLIGEFSGLRPLTNFSHTEWDKLIEINLTSSWRILKELEPLIRRSKRSKIIFLTNKKISIGQPYHNILSITMNAKNSMLNIFKEENKKLNVETYLIDIEEINAGVTNSLAGKNEFKKNLLNVTAKKIADLCI